MKFPCQNLSNSHRVFTVQCADKLCWIITKFGANLLFDRPVNVACS